MQQITDVAEGSWWDLCPCTVQEAVDQMDTVKAYEMIDGCMKMKE